MRLLEQIDVGEIESAQVELNRERIKDAFPALLIILFLDGLHPNVPLMER